MRKLLGLVSMAALLGGCASPSEEVCESYYSNPSSNFGQDYVARVLFYEGLADQAVGTPIGRAFGAYARTWENFYEFNRTLPIDTTGYEVPQWRKDMAHSYIESFMEQEEDLIRRCDEILSD
jgi:hypothetical protein